MKMLKILSVISMIFVGGCATSPEAKDDVVDAVQVIRGTSTAVVEVSVDKDGMPSVKNQYVEVEESQRVVWVGPDSMEIRFVKNSPFKDKKLDTKNSVVNAVIPRQKWGKSEKKATFKYDIIVDGKVLDPFLIVKRRL